MPIGEAHRSGASFTGLTEYVLAQGIYKPQNTDKKPEIVFNNFIYGSNYLEIGKQFKDQSNENNKVSKPVMHLTINFKTEDQISKNIQEDFVKKILSEMHVKDDNHQYLVVRHNDKHPHYHVIINRVGFDGKTLSDSNSKLRIGTACDKVEKEMGLDNYLEKTRAFIYDKENNSYKKNENRQINKGIVVIKPSKDRKIGIQEKKDYIQIQTLKILNNTKINKLEILQTELKNKGIEFNYSINKNNQVAVSFKYDGLAVKGTDISLKGNLIKKQLENNANSYGELKDKYEFLKVISDTNLNFKKAISEIADVFNKGKVPNYQLVFKEFGIAYDNKETIKYKNWTIDIQSLKPFFEKCEKILNDAIMNYEKQVKSYNDLQSLEFKKGFLGIITAEQRKFNDDLKSKLNNTTKPEFTVGISIDKYTKSIQSQINNIYNQVNSEKITRYIDYRIHESIDLEKQKANNIEKEIPTDNQVKDVKKGNTQSHDEDLEPIKRRKFKR